MAPNPLATAAEIRDLVARAIELLRIPAPASPEEDEGCVHQRGVRAALDALRFAASAAAQLQDHSLLSVLADAVAAVDHDHDVSESAGSTIGAGIAAILESGAPIDDTVRRLAEGGYHAQHAVIDALVVRDAEGLDILRRLGEVAYGVYARAVNERLVRLAPESWWQGKFAADPIPRVPPEQAQYLVPLLRRYAEIADLPSSERRRYTMEIERILAAMPGALAVEAAESLLAGLTPYDRLYVSAGAAVVCGPDSLGAVLRLAENCRDQPGGYDFPKALAAMMSKLAPDRALRLCRSLLDRLAATAPGEEVQYSDPRHRIAAAIALAWPAGADPTPILDAALARPDPNEHQIDWLKSALSDVLTRPDINLAPILPRLAEARLAGYPGNWQGVRVRADSALAGAPRTFLRPVADRALDRVEPETVEWGLLARLDTVYDPAVDPPRTVLVAGWYADERLRRQFRESWSLRPWALPILRDDLRRRRLDLGTAVGVLEAVGGLYGGLSPWTNPEEDPTKLAEKRRESIARYGDALGEPGFRGPPTDEEWAELRRLRAFKPPGIVSDWYEVLRALPAGAWAPEDIPLVEEAIGAWRSGCSDLDLDHGMVLSYKPTPAYVEVLKEMLDVGGEWRDHTEQCLFRACRVLKLPDPPYEAEDPESAEVARSGEWMDEKDDE